MRCAKRLAHNRICDGLALPLLIILNNKETFKDFQLTLVIVVPPPIIHLKKRRVSGSVLNPLFCSPVFTVNYGLVDQLRYHDHTTAYKQDKR